MIVISEKKSLQDYPNYQGTIYQPLLIKVKFVQKESTL